MREEGKFTIAHGAQTLSVIVAHTGLRGVHLPGRVVVQSLARGAVDGEQRVGDQVVDAPPELRVDRALDPSPFPFGCRPVPRLRSVGDEFGRGGFEIVEHGL